MQIAYLVITHTDPEFIRRLAEKVTRCTTNHVFVHVDGKIAIDGFERALAGLSNVHLLKERKAVYWGGYASIEATILLLSAAAGAGKFDRYVLLQGLDYPIKNNTEIDEFFEAHADTEFIRAASETDSNSNKDKHKYILRYHMDSPSKLARWRRGINVLILRYFPFGLPRPYVTIDRKRCEIYRGWAQFALTHAAVEYLLDFHNAHPEYNNYFRHVYAADESYFHTIIYNSHFDSKTVDGHPVAQKDRSILSLLNLTYFEYPDVVRMFQQAEEFEILEGSGYLYFRKASSKSTELLDHIDARHQLGSPGKKVDDSSEAAGVEE